jgi:hypothetical protein
LKISYIWGYANREVEYRSCRKAVASADCNQIRDFIVSKQEGAVYIPPVLPVWGKLFGKLLYSLLKNSSPNTNALRVTAGQIYELHLRHLEYTYRCIS